MIRLFLFIMVMAFPMLCHAQSFKVKEFTMSLADLSASTHQRTDAEGQPCGLVKVQTKIIGVEFGDNVIGKVENKTNEYWVYLPKGTKDFVIYRPDYLPMNIQLADYGLNSIDAKTTYQLVLKEVNLNSEKCGVTLHVRPRDAEVKIDESTLKVNSSGDYKVLLPKGEHICRINANGYKSDMRMVTTGKGVQDINVELESLMADVNIVSQTGTAEIFVNGESKGIGGWKGKMLPGEYVIEARQQGCVPQTNNVSLAEKEQRTIAIPKLTPVTGTLEVKSFPEGCKVYLDGNEQNQTPCVLQDIVYGNHLLVIKLDSCGLLRHKEFNFQIEDDKRKTIKCELVTNNVWNNHVKATNWFKKGCSYHYDILKWYNPEKFKAKEWYDKIIEIIDSLDAGFFTKNMVIPELREKYQREEEPYIVGLEINNIPGLKMIEYYNDEYIALDQSEGLYMDPNPDKAVVIAKKMGENIKCEHAINIALHYAEGKHQNHQKALSWFNKAKQMEGAENEYEAFLLEYCATM